MLRYKPTTIALISTIIITSAALMGLGVIIINPVINANAATRDTIAIKFNLEVCFLEIF
jgi:hypothetical protein